jgi:hypothetical protein
MPQTSLANFPVNEHGECSALHMPPSVQLDRKMVLIDASLERRRVLHFMKYISTKTEKRRHLQVQLGDVHQDKALSVVLIITSMNFSKA